MSEQLYYTFSTFGTGPRNGEGVRAQSPGLGPVNNNSARTLRKYLSYRLPAGTNPQISLEMTPIGLALINTEDKKYNAILVHKVSGGKNGVARSGNFFSHAIINPEVVSPQTGTVEPISARDAISLWKAPFWKTSEEQAPPRSTVIEESLTPEDISQYAASPGTLSALSIQQSYPHCSAERQTAADWLPLVFSAFLMLKKLNKKHLYIAAPAEMVATLIWCITRCLPRTLDIMQNLTFSTYESEIKPTTTISTPTITGTCWLPPANQSGQFVPQSDLPALCYQPTSFSLAINCYTQKQTPFQIDEPMSKFVQFATESLLQNDLAQLDQLIAQAERKKYQNINDFLTLVSIQEGPTKEIVQNILRDPQNWSCLQYPKVQDKLIELIYNIQDTNWVNWWETLGSNQLKRIHQEVKNHLQSEEAIALRAFADRVMSELSYQIATDLQGVNGWAMYWDQILKDISSPSTDLVVWATFPLRLSKLLYTKTYQSWWQQSGKSIAQELYQIAHNNTQPEECQQLATALDYWWQECAKRLKLTWTQRQDAEMVFWFDILMTIQPPTKGAHDWHTLLNDLDETLPQGSLPANRCKWETYKMLLVTWYLILAPQDYLPRRWLNVSWEYLPLLLATSDLPNAWKTFTLEDRIQLFLPPANPQMLSSVARCAPLIHEVLAKLIRNDQRREQTVTFCESLLQESYAQRDALLASILPALFPYEGLTNRIAAVARLSEEQLNEYMKDAFYNTLTSQQDLPVWLFPRLKSYLTNFRVEILNPDRQQMVWEESKRARDILNALKGNQTLPEELHPYVSCWHAISDFFSRPVFDLIKLRGIRNSIEAVELGEAMRQELHQEMITFLSRHVDNESDLTRTIDIFGETLLQSLDDVLPAHVLLLKEMVRLYSKHSQDSTSLPKTIMYIKVILSETINLAYPEAEQQKRKQSLDECLHSLLASVDQNLVKSIQTTQWSPAIAKHWEAYLSKGTLAQSPRMTKNAPPTQHSPVSPNITVPLPIVSPDPSPTKPLPAQIIPQVVPANNTNQPSMLHNPKADAVKKPSVVSAGEALKTFRKALKDKKVDKIAEAYDDRLDRWLTVDEIHTASIARKLVQTHELGKKTGDYSDFINMYNTHFTRYKGYVLSKDIVATVQQFREEEKKRKK